MTPPATSPPATASALWPFSRLGLGTGTLASWKGGLSFHEAQHLLDKARDHGVNVIDTADSYASGECERLLGRILRKSRDSFSVMTKAGYSTADLPGPLHLLNPFAKKVMHKLGSRQNFDPRYLENALKKSLRRLRLDEVDVFLLHDPPASALADGRIFETLDRMRRAGHAAKVGISSGEEEALQMAITWPGCGLIQTPLLPPGVLAGPLRNAEAARIPIVLNHVSLGGRLPRLDTTDDAELSFFRERIAKHCQSGNQGPQSALLAASIEATGAACVLTGTRNAGHLVENARAVNRLSS